MQPIYRIQDIEGRGPYKPGFSKNWCDEDARCLIGVPLFATYMEEFLDVQEKINTISRLSGGAFGCGFRTLDQLNRWFTQAEQEKLFKYKYSIVKIIPDMVLAESHNQLVFWCKKPLCQITHDP